MDASNDKIARSLTTVEDVLAMLESAEWSFEEALDGVRIARLAGDWDLVERAALSALAAVGNRSVRPTSLVEAAHAVAMAHLKRVVSFDLIGEGIRAAAEVLTEMQRSAKRAARAIDEEVQWLNEVALLIADRGTASLVSLCARLRRLDRPDLGRIAAGRALTQEPDNAKALTTRGAAAIDEVDLSAAEADLERAWTLTPSSYVANAMARLMLAWDRPDQAVIWARRAVQLDPSKASWSTLAAAALAVEDRGLFEDAVAELEAMALEQPSLFSDGLSHDWPLYLAGLTLVRSGRLGEAERVAGQLAGRGYEPATRLRAEIELARNRWGEPQNPRR